MNVRSARLALVPWFVLFAACSGDRVSENLGRVEEALTSNDRILGFEGTISGAAGSDWRPVVGTATSNTTHSEGSHSIALGGNQNPSAISAALTAMGTLSAAPSADVMFQTGYQPQGTYYGQAGLYFTCGTTINNQFLGSIQLHGPTGSFNHYTFASLPQNVATALSTTNGCTVKVELNLSNTGSIPVLVDKLSFGQASGSGGTGGNGGGAGSSGAAGKAGSGSGAGGKAGAAGTSGGGAGGGSGVGGSGGAGAGGKSGGGGASGGGASGAGAGGAGAAGKSGGGGAGGAGAAGISGSGGTAGAGAGGISGGGAGGARGGAAGAGAGGAGAGGAGAGGAGGGSGIEFYIDLPVHVPRTSVALGTTGGALVLSDYVRVLAPTSGFSSVSSVKTATETNLGVSAETLNLWSEANVVVLRDGAYVHGNLTTEGTVNTQNNVHVTGIETVNGTLTPIQHQSWIVQFPATNGGPVNLDVSQVRTITPGAYGGSTVQRNARLTLSGSGRYTLDGLFDLEPSSTLDVDNTQGPVQIYASGGFTFRGTIAPRDPTKNNILIGIAGAGPIPMDTSFNAILVAPHGDVTLGSVSAGHSGAIYARSVNVGAHTDFHHRPFAPSDVCPAGAACDGLCQCNPGGGCDDNGDCATDVECAQNECGGPTGACTTSSQCGPGLDCTSGTCQSHCALNPHAPECIPTHCINGVKDGDETDVDCGGACNGCGTKHQCGKDADCGSGLVCGPHNGGCFDDSRAKSLCWPAECAGVVDASECGSADSPCGHNCSCAVTCDSTSPSNNCAAGDSCVPGGGAMLGLNTQDACLPAGCPTADPALAGTPTSLCGPTRICTPDCSHATCGNADDGCGGQCRAVCPKGGGPCTADVQCQPGETCPASVDPNTPRVCRVADVCMYGPLKPPLCGPGALCGPCPICTPQCGGKQCGPDPACGTDCGTCAAGDYCDGNGQCETPANDPPLTVPNGSGTPAPLPDLPSTPSSGVGAVAGSFAVTEQGTAQYTIPIDVPPGRAGIQPALSLVYSDPHSSTAVGVGWHLEGLSTITRCSHIYALDNITSPVKGDDTDFFCIDGKRLTAISGDYGKDGTEYRTQIDTFSKITSSSFQSGGPDNFTVWTKDGRILRYGNSCDSQVVGKGVRYSWLLNSVADHAGNTMNISYQNNNALLQQTFDRAVPASVIPSSITYTSHGNSQGNRQVRFTYEARPDRSLRFLQGGIADLKDQRLSRITTYVSNQPVKNYHLKYPATGPSELYQITECEKDGDTGCKAPTTFEYTTQNVTHFDTAIGSTIDMGAQLDANGDGIPDFTAAQVTTGPPANPPTAPRAITDIGIQTAGLFAPPGVGEFVSLFWNEIYPSLWGSKYVHPYMRESDFLYVGNGSRSSNPFLAKDVQFVCGAASEMHFMDFDRDGKDDIGGFCSYDNQQQRDNLSLGFWTDPPGAFQTLNSYTSGAHIYAASISISNLPHKDPILYDIDGDSLEDLLWCQDSYTLQLRRRKPADAVLQPGEEFFYDPITLTAPTSGPPLLLCETDSDSHTFLDIDGDGTADLLARDFSNGWSVLKYSKTGSDDLGKIAWQPLGFADSGDPQGGNVTLGDYNGDGLADFMRIDGNQATIWLNMGNGAFFTRNLDHPVPSTNYEYRRSALFDYNGDGSTDLLENWGDNGVGYSVAMMLNGDASAFLPPVVATDIQAYTADGALISATFDGATDIDADGNVDLLGPHGSNYGHRAQYQQLSRVTDGLGNVVTVNYDAPNTYTQTCTGSTWPETCLKHMTGLVSSYSNQVTDNDGQTLVGESSHTYTYANARMNTEGHGFLGFDSRTIVENFDDHVPLQPANRKTTITAEAPARYTVAGQPTTGSAPPYVYPLAGLTHSITVDETVSTNGTTQPLETDNYQRRMHVENGWQVGLSAYGRPFPKLSTRDTTLYDRRVAAPDSDNGQLLTEHAEAFIIDTMGNMYTHDEEFQPNDSGGAFETRNMTAFYDVDVDNWLIAKPKSVTTRTKRGNDSELAHDNEYTYYDNGFLKTVSRESGSQRLWQTAYLRDDFGNAYQITDTGSNGETPRTTTITFDEDNIFPTLIVNAANQSTQIHFDTSWGVPKTVIDPNGIAVRTSYDGLGLVSSEIDAEGTTTYTYSSLAPGAVTGATAAGTIRPRTSLTVDRQGTGPSHGSHVTSQLDSHGRTVRTTAVGFNGVDVITESVFDGRGRVAGTTLAHSRDAQIVPSSLYSYDDLNRLTGVQRSDGSTIQHQYASRVTLNQNYSKWLTGIDCGTGNSACVTDVELDIDDRGRRNVSIKDYGGHVLRSIDENNIGTVAESDSYLFGSGGHLLTAYDHLGNATSLEYDVFDRLIGETDRDVQHKGYTYDSFNQIATSTDASLRLRTYFHDVLGRLREVDDADGVTTWTYDQGVNGLGRLSSMVSPATAENPDGQQIDYTYEPVADVNRGLLHQVDYVLDHTHHTFTFDYDDLGRSRRIDYPDLGTGNQITALYHYDDASGGLKSLTQRNANGSEKPLWQMTEAYQGQLVQSETFGNGVTTTYQYTPEQHWLMTIATQRGATPVQHLGYTFWPTGQVMTRSNGVSQNDLTYDYDTLSRLGTLTPVVAGQQQPAVSFGYDDIDNLTQRSGTSTAYKPGGSHFVDSVGSNVYHYDANGNVQDRSGPDIPGGTQTFTYTPFDLPRVITTGNNTTKFDYSADEDRVVRRDPSVGTRYFAGALYQRFADPSGTTQDERFRLYAGARLVGEIVRKSGTDETLFFHTDHLGSIDTITNDLDSSVQHQDYDPFGKETLTPSTALTRAGFTGQDHDRDLGLIDMHGRIYDPLAGRFLTADPLMQGLNHYGYVQNDPINFTDPSGLFSLNGDAATGVMEFEGVDPVTVPRPSAAGGGTFGSFGDIPDVTGTPVGGGFQGAFGDPASVVAAATNIVRDLIDLAGGTPGAGSPITTTLPVGQHAPPNIGATHSGPSALGQNHGAAGPAPVQEGAPRSPMPGAQLASDSSQDQMMCSLFGCDPDTGELRPGSKFVIPELPSGGSSVAPVGKGGPSLWSRFTRWLRGGATPAEVVEDALSGLRAGRSAGVKVVDSTKDLRSLYDRLSAGGRVVPKPTYPGEFVELSDGTTVGLREASKSGGPTMDIQLSGGARWKVHISLPPGAI